MSKRLLTFVFVLTIATNIFAQGAGGISGTVVDENGAKVAGAQVVLRSSSGVYLTTSTDQAGAFKFENLRSGSYFVEVKANGAKVSKKRIQEEVPIYEEHSVDRDLLIEGERNLREYFQSEGYFEASVAFQEGRVVNGKQEIDYEVELRFSHLADKLEDAAD